MAEPDLLVVVLNTMVRSGTMVRLVIMVLLYKVLMVLHKVLVLSSSIVPNDVHRLQVLDRVAMAGVGGAVEGGRL